MIKIIMVHYFSHTHAEGDIVLWNSRREPERGWGTTPGIATLSICIYSFSIHTHVVFNSLSIFAAYPFISGTGIYEFPFCLFISCFGWVVLCCSYPFCDWCLKKVKLFVKKISCWTRRYRRIGHIRLLWALDMDSNCVLLYICDFDE